MTPAYDGPVNAEVLIVGEAWGEREANYRKCKECPITPRPFVGPSGALLDEMCIAAGYSRSRCRVTNVVHAQPPGNKIDKWLVDTANKAKKAGFTIEHRGMWMNETVWEGVQELYREIERLQPRLIIALGNTPLWALTGEQGITKWRGSEMWYEAAEGRTNIPVIPTLHPAYVLRAYKEKPTVIHDLRHRAFGKIESGHTPPDWNYRVDPGSLEMLDSWLGVLIDRLNEGPALVAVDVETRLTPYARTVCIGFGWSETDAICIPLERADGMSYWRDDTEAVKERVRRILTHPNIRPVGQNFNYDAVYIEQDFGLRVYAAWDTGVAQHLMFPGMPKDLARIASYYCDYYRYWKDDLKEWVADWAEERMWRYNCMDCTYTYEIAVKQVKVTSQMGLWKGEWSR
jgi:DNA polymerase